MIKSKELCVNDASGRAGRKLDEVVNEFFQSDEFKGAELISIHYQVNGFYHCALIIYSTWADERYFDADARVNYERSL